MTRFPRTEDVLAAALHARAFTAVTAEIGHSSGTPWTYAGGRLARDENALAVTPATIFDLASLTKVLATTPLGLTLVAARQLDLDRPVAAILKGWGKPDRATVTVRDLFEHSSGLPAHRPFFKTLSGRSAYEAAIADEPLEYAPRTRSIYSDLGFIVLGFILEDVGRASLDAQFAQWRTRAEIAGPLAYLPPPEWKPHTASTSHDVWRGRVLQGEVHDENAAALGGVAAHAGLFGTAASVGEVARWWLARLTGQPDVQLGISSADATVFTRRSTVPGSSRALGWDTMLTTSSCGSRLSERAVGHTGFTGTSLWIDPARDLYAVLLSNHVHEGRDKERIRQVRRAFHDAMIEDL